MELTRARWPALIALCAVFGWMTALALGPQPPAFDLTIRHWVAQWDWPPLTWAMFASTQLGGELFLLPLGALALHRLLRANRRADALWFAFTALSAEAFAQTVKITVARPRPAAFFAYPLPGTYSFPSGHAMLSVCFYGALAVVYAKRLPGCARICVVAAAALTIGFTRVYLGVHYPTDVVAGWAAGLAWLLVASTLRRQQSFHVQSGESPSSLPPS